MNPINFHEVSERIRLGVPGEEAIMQEYYKANPMDDFFKWTVVGMLEDPRLRSGAIWIMRDNPAFFPYADFWISSIPVRPELFGWKAIVEQAQRQCKARDRVELMLMNE